MKDEFARSAKVFIFFHVNLLMVKMYTILNRLQIV